VRAFLQPTGMHSPAMVRIAKALARHAPPGVEVTRDRSGADLVVLYVIDDVQQETHRLRARGQRYAMVQCCLRTCAGRPDPVAWRDIWAGAECVWSYYDLSPWFGEGSFYHAPLGVDDAFKGAAPNGPRRRLVVTTGCVSAPNAEAIEEVWAAAELAGVQAIHVGPENVPGVPSGKSLGWVTDAQLAALYRQAGFVAALRHVEGFEMPAAEGLACGALPILFEQEATRRWYDGRAALLPECSGEELVQSLVRTLRIDAEYLKGSEAWAPFDWSAIVAGFWSCVLARQEVAA
jgi:hypothetical protein